MKKILIVLALFLSATGCQNSEKQSKIDHIKQAQNEPDDKIKLVKILYAENWGDVYDNDVKIGSYYLFTKTEQLIPVESKGVLPTSRMSIDEYLSALASSGKLQSDTIRFDNGEPGMAYGYVIYNIKNIQVVPATIY